MVTYRNICLFFSQGDGYVHSKYSVAQVFLELSQVAVFCEIILRCSHSQEHYQTDVLSPQTGNTWLTAAEIQSVPQGRKSRRSENKGLFELKTVNLLYQSLQSFKAPSIGVKYVRHTKS